MRGSLPHLGECSFIAADSYGSLSWQLADENPRPSCHDQCCRAPQLLSAASRGELGIPENLFFFFWDVLTAEQCSGKLNHQCLLLQRRESENSLHYKSGAGWVTGGSFGGTQGDFYIYIPTHSLSKIQTAVLASNISGWQAMDQYKLSCQQEGTDGQKALFARQPEAFQGFTLHKFYFKCVNKSCDWPQDLLTHKHWEQPSQADWTSRV